MDWRVVMSKSYIEICCNADNNNDPDLTLPVVRIELPTQCESIWSVLDNLIKPALLASGFAQQTVDSLQVEDTTRESE